MARVGSWYIDATDISYLALDEVMQFQANYYAIVKDTSTGEGAFELLANPQTGAVLAEMGPNMMWNTQYGHMAAFGLMGGFVQQPSVAQSVSTDQGTADCAAMAGPEAAGQHHRNGRHVARLLHASHHKRRHDHGHVVGQRLHRPGVGITPGPALL
jgi:hypothetical protein